MRWGARTGEYGDASFGDVVPTVSAQDALAPQFDPSLPMVPTMPVVDAVTGRVTPMATGPGGTPYPPRAGGTMPPALWIAAAVVAYLVLA